MQAINIHNDLYSPNKIKCIEVNNFGPNVANQKNFKNGLENAFNIINDLERSIHKSSNYENRILRCKATHSHSHDDVNVWWESDPSDRSLKFSSTGASKSSRNHITSDVTESWSTVSIVCLQYQFEELSKRYKALLQAYDEQCSAVNARDIALCRLRHRLKSTHAHLAHAHKTLLTVGQIYLALKSKRNKQKSCYKAKIKQMEKLIRDIVENTERSRLKFEARLSACMAKEQDPQTALLLVEMRKCNLLFLENLKLKAEIEGLAPGRVDWNNN